MHSSRTFSNTSSTESLVTHGVMHYKTIFKIRKELTGVRGDLVDWPHRYHAY